MKIIRVDYPVSDCSNCPFLGHGRTFGNDGRDGTKVYKCKKGVFGGKCSFGYDTGLSTIPAVPPLGCPYFDSDPLDRVASALRIEPSELSKILEQEKCLLKQMEV